MQSAAPALGNTAKATCSGGTTTPLSPAFPTPSPSSGAGSSQPGALIFSGLPFRSISRELLMRKTAAAVFHAKNGSSRFSCEKRQQPFFVAVRVRSPLRLSRACLGNF